MAERDVYLVHRGFASSAPSARLASVNSIEPALGHWGMNVVDSSGRGTRFEAFKENGRLKLSESSVTRDSGFERVNMPYAGRGKTTLTDREIRAHGNRIIAEKPEYMPGVNDCQTVGFILVDDTVKENTKLGKFHAWIRRRFRKLA